MYFASLFFTDRIQVCQDVPVPNEAAVSSAPTGTIEGIGVHNYVCFAVVMAHPPNSRIQVSCPVLNVTSPINVQVKNSYTASIKFYRIIN